MAEKTQVGVVNTKFSWQEPKNLDRRIAFTTTARGMRVSPQTRGKKPCDGTAPWQLVFKVDGAYLRACTRHGKRGHLVPVPTPQAAIEQQHRMETSCWKPCLTKRKVVSKLGKVKHVCVGGFAKLCVTKLVADEPFGAAPRRIR